MPTGRFNSTPSIPRFRRGIYSADRPLHLDKGIAMNERVHVPEDFLGDAGQTLPPPWVGTKVGTSGNNTIDYGGAVNGTYVMTHSADDEVQTMRVDWGNSLMINLSQGPRLEARAKINFAGATFTADQRWVLGFASAYDAALDDVSFNAWFRVEGAALTLFAEVDDDDAVDDDDNDTGGAVVDDTYHIYEVDCTNLAAVGFWFAGVKLTELDLSGVPANTLVQPICCIQKDAGTDADATHLDYMHISYGRT